MPVDPPTVHDPSDAASAGASAARRARRRALGLLAAGALAPLAGCVVAPLGSDPRVVYYPQPVPPGDPRDADGDGYADGTIATLPPPAPPYEVVGVAPFVGAVWIGGYWNWYGGRYAWVPGYWGPPRPGYTWVPPSWHRRGPGWRQSRGGWHRR
jgi:hypothetical protein